MKQALWQGKVLPLIMGIMNLSPDSFYTGSCQTAVDHLLSTAENMIRSGCDIIDIGAESTRPGAQVVSPDLELERLIPALCALRSHFPNIPISVDTTKAQVAIACLEQGVEIINDVSGLNWGTGMIHALLKYQPYYVLMHIQGVPATMQENPQYDDVVAEICSFWNERTRWLIDQGFPEELIIVDPGIGFGKSVEHNLRIMRHLQCLRNVGFPLLIGLSRKSFLGKLLNLPDPQDRLHATIVMHTLSIQQGVDILRVHDVLPAVQARTLIRELELII